MNRNQLKGRANAAMGKIKEITGRLTGKDAMERKGNAETQGGKVEAGYGDTKDDFSKATKMSPVFTPHGT